MCLAASNARIHFWKWCHGRRNTDDVELWILYKLSVKAIHFWLFKGGLVSLSRVAACETEEEDAAARRRLLAFGTLCIRG